MLTRRGRELSKTSLTLSEETSLRRELRVFPFSATGLPAPTSFTVYVETPTTFIVPPFWTSETSTSEEKPQDTRSPGKKVSMPFHGTLRPTLKQPEAYDAIVHHFQQYHGGVMCLPTGYGKTTVALAVASHLGRKTLVLVHKRFLADQWKERITTFLPTASVSLYGCGAADPTGDVVVATIQTILSKGFPAHYAADIGTVIVDEVHRIAAPSFSKALFAGLNAPFLLGLSATPERADKLTKVIHWLCGPLVYSHQLQTATASTVHIVTYKEPCDIPLNRRGDVDHASLITQLAENDARTAFLLDAMDRLVLTPHTHCLILSHRRAHCMVLAECLRLRGYDAATYLGGDTQIPPSNILVSTYALVSEGFDQPRLTALVLATPASNVTQAVGRILRGGSHGTILDLVDANPVSYAQASKRRKYYTASGFRVVSNGASEPNNAYMFREEPKKSVSI